MFANPRLENTQAMESCVVGNGTRASFAQSSPFQYLKGGGFNFAGLESRIPF